MLIKSLCCLRRRQWQLSPVLLPGKSHGWRSLVGCSPWVATSQTRVSDFTFTFHFHALEMEMATHSSVLAWRIPGTGGAWWAAVYGVAQSQTQLKWLSSSSIVYIRASLVAQIVKNLPAMQMTRVRSLGWEDLLEKGMAINSSEDRQATVHGVEKSWLTD